MTGFGDHVARIADTGGLVVQPRMGFSDPARMRCGLIATRLAEAATVGTITLDSYTRVGAFAEAGRALRAGVALNGYPIVTHPRSTTESVVAGLRGPDFPVQIRHGSANPEPIVRALIGAGFDATEGGPVSYCLPYGRLPLRRSVTNWARACELLAEVPGAHLETFGGCMMGQLCPPGLLVAISVLEALFFERHGLRDISLSYAQQTDDAQDEEAVRALRRLAGELLGGNVRWHVVIYAYMGVYPRTPVGATGLLARAARLARRSGAARLIVKTAAEAFRIPTIAENIVALEGAARAAESPGDPAGTDTGQVYREARALVRAVLDLHPDVGRALVRAFESGLLDVPYCLHPDNAGNARAHLDRDGRLVWSDLGALPIRDVARVEPAARMTSTTLLAALSHVRRTFDTDPTHSRGTQA